MRTSFLLLLVLCISSFCKNQPPAAVEPTSNATPLQKAGSVAESDNGIVYLSTDNGATWKNASAGLPQQTSIGLGGIAVSESLLGVATVEHGVYFFNFKDSTWVHVPTAPEIIAGGIGPLALFKQTIYVGTQDNGIFCSTDHGKTWFSQNNGLHNLTIRRFVELEHKLYVCTNDGLYSLHKNAQKWHPEFSDIAVQVNGATIFNGSIFIGTNKGVFKKQKDHQWVNILPNRSVHNISSDDSDIFAMTYDEWLLSSMDGIEWQHIQDGLPKNLYTFNVLNHQNMLFAGQWDGVYCKPPFGSTWMLSNKGIPEKFAATNLKSFKGILVVTTSKRKLNQN